MTGLAQVDDDALSRCAGLMLSRGLEHCYHARSLTYCNEQIVIRRSIRRRV